MLKTGLPHTQGNSGNFDLFLKLREVLIFLKFKESFKNLKFSEFSFARFRMRLN